MNVNTNVNTATRESDEQFKTDKYLRYAVADGDDVWILSRPSFLHRQPIIWRRAGYASIRIMMADSGLTGLFRRVSAEYYTEPHSVHHYADRVHCAGRKTVLQDAHPRKLF
jgi:hypothetical protein